MSTEENKALLQRFTMMVEHWGVTDNLAMMQQLGVVPTP